jgi:hypothetical protein
VSFWDWVEEFERQARARGDGERLRLQAFHREAFACRYREPQRMLAILQQGRHLATALDEPWWVFFFDHWQVETLLFYAWDYRRLIDRALAQVLRLRRPELAQHPLRHATYLHLLRAYLEVDTPGYAAQAREVFAFLEADVPDHGEARYSLLCLQSSFARSEGRLDDALACGRRVLELSTSDRCLYYHHQQYAHVDLCTTYRRRGDWIDLENHAAAGEELARRQSNSYLVGLFQVWQALCARRAGEELQAGRYLRQGTARLERCACSRGDESFNTVCAYHEHAGDLEAALRARGQQLAGLIDRGLFISECRCRIDRCRLLAALGRPLAAEVRAAREVAGRLHDPAPHLAELDRIGAAAGKEGP